MYDREGKCWICFDYDRKTLSWAKSQKDDLRAQFILADRMLAEAPSGKNTADAVYLMESSAKSDYVDAALAMGQMFQFGWCVGKSREDAKKWYETAASLGSAEALDLLDALERNEDETPSGEDENEKTDETETHRENKKSKRRKWPVAVAVTALAVAAAAALIFIVPAVTAIQGVRVHRDTELVEPETFEDFNKTVNKLVEDNDDELVISGQRSSNRLLLMFEGDGLDLSAFPADTVVVAEDNYVVIQFSSEDEAQKCLESLLKNDSVLFVEEDKYGDYLNSSAPSVRPDYGSVYTSPYTGDTYMSWGIAYMGIDELLAYAKTVQKRTVTVAVLDTGCEPNAETASRMLEGIDTFGEYSNGQVDGHSHGTHVAGTIFDCTRGLDVQILPVRVMHESSDGSAYGGVTQNGRSSTIIDGLRYAMAQNVDVINMSLGGYFDATDPTDSHYGGKDAEDALIHLATQRGIVVVVSAGNEDEDTAHCCPAHLEDAIVVAACDQAGLPSDYGTDSYGNTYGSNFGSSVDVAAPGSEILSFIPGYDLDFKDGTSMAAPHIAGLAAILRTYLTDRSPQQIEKYIRTYCTEMVYPGEYGEGIPWVGYFAEG